MRWFNLKQNKCPDCNKKFKTFTQDGILCKCGFFISTKKFKQIVDDMVNKPQRNFEINNQEALNNF